VPASINPLKCGEIMTVIQGTSYLGNILVREGKISSEQLAEALEEQKATMERLGEILARRGWIDEQDLFRALSDQLGFRVFDPARDEVQPQALELVSGEFAARRGLVPVRVHGGVFTVAMIDPLDLEARDRLERVARERGLRLEIIVGPSETIGRARDAAYSQVDGSRHVSSLVDRVVDEVRESAQGRETGEKDETVEAQEAGVVELVDQIIARAMAEKATDIHIEPHADQLVVRYRIDGLLSDALLLPKAVYTGTISRLKILAHMDIAERRAAQDGRMSHSAGGREVDIRASAIPTIHGEKLVLRLLNKSNFDFRLKDLGFSIADYEAFRRAIHQPHGLVLLSGPTGSGKTTTLYCALLELRNETTNITTVEDPIEYQMDRINQVQVNARKQVTFANALRAFLRQDPDVIMVGEIRDQETADISVRAALTGHMVFSTIHANDAPSTVTRLVSMGTEPFMAASALSLVAAQRLVRRNCPHCLQEYRPEDELLVALGLSDGEIPQFVRGTGCAACRGRGFDGRLAVLERMSMNADLRQLVADGAPAGEIRRQALAGGMSTLLGNGLDRVRQGTTTVEEVLRICAAEE
jgi:type IV pilus assembly protein PilB